MASNGVSDDYADKLAVVAIEAISRVRERDPDSFDRWLLAIAPPGVHPVRWYRQLVAMLALAVPDDASWSRLVSWARNPESVPRGRRLQPCGTRAAAIRHRRHGEDVCPLCREAELAYFADYHRPQPVQNFVDKAVA